MARALAVAEGRTVAPPPRRLRRRLLAVLAGVVVGAMAVPAASATNWSAGVAGGSAGQAHSGVVAETINGTCTASAGTASCGSTSLLPAAASSTTASLTNAGTVPSSFGITATACGEATVSDSQSTQTVAHGSFTSSSYQAAGPLSGKAVTFDGSSTWLGTGGSATSGVANYTEALWFKTTSSVGGVMLEFEDTQSPATSSGSSHDRILWMDNAGHVYVGADSNVEAASSSTYNDGNWHMVAARLSPTTGLRLYIDGATIATNGSQTSGTVFSGWWLIGAGTLTAWSNQPTVNGSGVGYFKGSIAGVAVFPSSLTGTQITSLSSSASISAYATTVASDGPSHYWGLQDAAPTPATASAASLPGQTGAYPDLSGAADDATAAGGVTSSASGPLSAGASTTFDGSTGILTTGGGATSGLQTFTQLAWIKTTGSGVIMSFANTTPPASAADWDRHLWVDPTGHVVAGEFPGTFHTVTSTSVVNNGAWHLAAVTLSSAGLKLYVDGSLQATDSSGTSAQSYSGWWSVGAGKLLSWSDTPTLDGNGVSWFAGSLAGVAVLPTALTATQIASLYASSSFSAYSAAVLGDGPSAYWTLLNTANGCSAALVTASITIGGVTTCLLPAAPSGTACPAVASGGLPLVDATTYGADTAVTLAAGGTATITVSVADNGTLPTVLGGADLLADLTVTEVDGTWTTTAVFTASQTQL